MLFLAVEVDAVARTEHHHFFLDGYFELTFYHVVIFLTVVSVLVRFAVARQWVNLHHERVHLSVLEAYGKALVFILVVAISSFFVPMASTKWAMLSPVIVPMFMQASMTPEFAMAVFRAADTNASYN